MIYLELDPQGRARVWLQALPDYSFFPAEVMERKVSATTTVRAAARRAAIEAFVHKGGYCPCGLLGAEFVPDLSGMLTVQVMAASADLELLPHMLPGFTDQVRRGLPREYADSVMEGAIYTNSISPLGSGVLQFNCAAHGEVGSSPNAFRQLGEMVTRLLQMDPSSVTVEQLLDLIQHKL